MSFIMRFISPPVYQQKPYTKSSFKDSIDFFIVFTIYDRNYRTKLLGKHLATGNLTIKAQQFFLSNASLIWTTLYRIENIYEL